MGEKTYVHTKTCTWIFTGELFLTDKNWKQSKSPPCGERINKMRSTFHYHTIKRHKLLIHATTRMNLRNTVLRERSQTRLHIAWLHIYETHLKDRTFQPIETESRSFAVWVWGRRGDWRQTGGRELWGLMEVFSPELHWLFHHCINLLKIIKLYTQHRWILWYINDTSIQTPNNSRLATFSASKTLY